MLLFPTGYRSPFRKLDVAPHGRTGFPPPARPRRGAFSAPGLFAPRQRCSSASAFVASASGVTAKESPPRPMSRSSPPFSSGRFRVSRLVFESSARFELIFTCGYKMRLRFPSFACCPPYRRACSFSTVYAWLLVQGQAAIWGGFVSGLPGPSPGSRFCFPPGPRHLPTWSSDAF